MIVVSDSRVRMYAEVVIHAFYARPEGIERDATANHVSLRRDTVAVHDLVRLARRTTGARRGGRARAKVVRTVRLMDTLEERALRSGRESGLRSERRDFSTEGQKAQRRRNTRS